MAGPSTKLKQPPPIVLSPSDPRHAKAQAQLADDHLSEIDGEAYLRWLETGEGEDPCRDSSD
jgi:hypothetical protein